MSKKKFKDRWYGKILLNKVVKEGLKGMPFIGPLASIVLDDIKGDGKGEIISPSGSINKKDPAPLISAIVGVILVIFWLTGVISFEDAEQAKELFN